jgi:hypothetical protein
MGITVIDFGNVELKGRGNVKALAESAKGEAWEAEVVDVSYGVSSQKKSPYIEVVYKVTDENAVDIDGEPFKGKVWDKIWFSSKAAGIAKSKLETLGYDTSELHVRNEDDIKDLAADLKAERLGTPVGLVTYNEEDESGATYKDGTPKQWTRVRFVNEQ